MLGSLQILQRLFLAIVVAVALSATSFAHHVPSVEEPALQAYVLAGGTSGDLCGDADGNGLLGHPDCPACHIVATVHLPDPGLALRDADLVLIAKVVAPRESRAVRAILDPVRSLRAPPLV